MNTDKKLNIAIVCSGHLRLVPYGYYLIEQIAEKCNFDYTIYNFHWDQESDWSGNVPHGQTVQVLSQPNVKSEERYQKDLMEYLRRSFEEYGAVPPSNRHYMPGYYSLTNEDFSRFLGQVVGFLFALDYWQNDLRKHDLLIRCRWDIIPDWDVIKFIQEGRFSVDKRFITHAIYMREGEIELGGDTIYGRPEDWIDCMTPIGHSLEKLKAGCKKRFEEIKDSAIYNNLDQDYALRSKWFNSHFLWGTLFKGTRYSLIQYGQAPNIRNYDLPLNPKDVRIDMIYPRDPFSEPKNNEDSTNNGN